MNITQDDETKKLLRMLIDELETQNQLKLFELNFLTSKSLIKKLEEKYEYNHFTKTMK